MWLHLHHILPVLLISWRILFEMDKSLDICLLPHLLAFWSPHLPLPSPKEISWSLCQLQHSGDAGEKSIMVASRLVIYSCKMHHYYRYTFFITGADPVRILLKPLNFLLALKKIVIVFISTTRFMVTKKTPGTQNAFACV